MPKLLLTEKESVLAAFSRHNQARFQRTIDLTRQAITRLKAAGQKVTLAGVSEATRSLDDSGKGLSPNTILRNVEARELFHQESADYQQRRKQIGKIKRRRSRVRDISNLALEYRGLRTSELLEIIVQLKQTNAELQTRQTKLQADRDAIHQCCEELLQQNIRQLATLTQLKATAPS